MTSPLKVKVELWLEVDLEAYRGEYGEKFTATQVREMLQSDAFEATAHALRHLPVTVSRDLRRG